MREEKRPRFIAPMLLVVFLASPSFTWALTTFGKTNTQTQNANPLPPPTPVGKARECKLDSDCSGIQNTTCMADPQDGRTRCLCGDYSAPLNGACTNKFKALRAPCNEDTECIEGARCIQRNSTTTGKRCYCQEPYYEESPFLCNSCETTFTFSVTTLLAASLLLAKLDYL